MIASATQGVKPARQPGSFVAAWIASLKQPTREELERQFDAAYWGGTTPSEHDLHVNQCDYTHQLREYLTRHGMEDDRC